MRYSKVLVMMWVGVLIGFLPDKVATGEEFIVRVRIVPDQNVEVDKVEFIPKDRNAVIEGSFVKTSRKGKNIYTATLSRGEYEIRVNKQGYTADNKTIIIPHRHKEVVIYLKPENSATQSSTTKPIKKTLTAVEKKLDVSTAPVYNQLKSVVETNPSKPMEASNWILTQKPEPPSNPLGTLLIFNLSQGEHTIEINGEKQTVIITNSNVKLDARLFFPDTKKRTIDCKLGQKKYSLEFVRIRPVANNGENVITLSLTEDKAKMFYQKSQELAGASPLQPLIFKSVFDRTVGKIGVISEFWIQTETISEKLYKKIIPNGSVDKVSYQEAQQVINRLNGECKGYQFDLPTEQQFVYLAKKIYNPVINDKLEKCQSLKDKEIDGVKQLLGNQWQLTQSSCQSWSDDLTDPSRQCNPQYYVKKGGTIASRDASECMPEYRAESTPDVSEPNTTIRLVLKPNNHLK